MSPSCQPSLFAAMLALLTSPASVQATPEPTQRLCADTTGSTTDASESGCTKYELNQQLCGSYDDIEFTAAHMCCACGGGGLDLQVTTTVLGHEAILPRSLGQPPSACADSSRNASDSGGDGCEWYADGNQEDCGDWDDTDFTSIEMCCACGSGRDSPPQDIYMEMYCPTGRRWFAFKLDGSSARGAPVYKATDGTGDIVIFHDPDCNDAGQDARWIISPKDIDLNRESDLDGDGGCSYTGDYLSTDESSPPLGVSTWNMVCPGGSTLEQTQVWIAEASCAEGSGSATDAVEDGCDWYQEGGRRGFCGDADDDDFTATEMCCECGAGYSNGPAVQTVFIAIQCPSGSLGFFFTLSGRSASGAPVYTDVSGGYVIYHDQDCDGTGKPERWILDENTNVNANLDSDLDADGECHDFGHVDSTDRSGLPLGESTWEIQCAGGRLPTQVTITEASCEDISGSGRDSFGDPCEWYDGNEFACGDGDDTDFTASAMCCACGADYRCADTSGSAVDNGGDDCNWYKGQDQYCGVHDDEDFTATDMCCACHGGKANRRPTPAACVDSTASATDCAGYDGMHFLCGAYDDSDFTATDMCCLCDGGYRDGTPALTPAPTPAPTPSTTQRPTSTLALVTQAPAEEDEEDEEDKLWGFSELEWTAIGVGLTAVPAIGAALVHVWKICHPALHQQQPAGDPDAAQVAAAATPACSTGPEAAVQAGDEPARRDPRRIPTRFSAYSSADSVYEV